MKTIDTTAIMALRRDILAENDALKKAASAAVAQGSGPEQLAFGEAMTAAFNQINVLQHTAGDMTQDYTMGKTTDIAGVMMARQKSSLGFELTLQVRNKLMKAYQDIMSMPV